MGYCVGVIGLRPDDFWNLEDLEITSIVESFENNKTSTVRLELEQKRLQSYFSVAVQNSKIKKPQHLYKFEWEKSDTKILTNEEFDQLIALYGIPEFTK